MKTIMKKKLVGLGLLSLVLASCGVKGDVKGLLTLKEFTVKWKKMKTPLKSFEGYNKEYIKKECKKDDRALWKGEKGCFKKTKLSYKEKAARIYDLRIENNLLYKKIEDNKKLINKNEEEIKNNTKVFDKWWKGKVESKKNKNMKECSAINQRKKKAELMKEKGELILKKMNKKFLKPMQKLIKANEKKETRRIEITSELIKLGYKIT